MQRLAGWVARCVQPALIVEPYRVHHHPVAFPLADGIAQPCGLRVWRLFPAIGEYLTEGRVGLVKHNYHAGRLDDLVRNRTDLFAAVQLDLSGRKLQPGNSVGEGGSRPVDPLAAQRKQGEFIYWGPGP
jgi:hypothetical protein